jgi:beta-galactosidase GanA
VRTAPTAAPPIWLAKKHPEILPLDAQGLKRHEGTRRAYCMNSDVYWEYTRKILRALVAALVYMLKPIMGAHVEANERIRMIGSRFSPLTEAESTLANRPSVALDDRAIPDARQGMISSH